MNEQDKLQKELDVFRHEHQELDEMIADYASEHRGDELTIQRLKKRKLWLKDKITELEAMIYPDIIA